jgi:ATP-dependent DNA helicase RecQ
MILLMKQGAQRKAIMDSFMAAQKYCLLATCRRRFLLQYFGEELNSDCGILSLSLKEQF